MDLNKEAVALQAAATRLLMQRWRTNAWIWVSHDEAQIFAPYPMSNGPSVKTTPQKTRFRSVNNYKEFTYR